MIERKGVVTLLGNPVTLEGRQTVGVGDALPSCQALDNGLAPVSLASFKGKVLILLTVPSLDTPVCDTEARRFNSAAAGLDSDIVVALVSMDLPFAQARWCGAAGIERVVTLSDHRDADCGLALGVLVKEVRLLARAVFVVDRGGVVRHAQIVPEVAQEPDYAAVLAAAQAAL